MERYNLKIVIPAFNEEGSIFSVVRSIISCGEVIVVDDGSTDNTAKFAEESGASVISHKINKGYDWALNTGFHEACLRGSEFILTFDADGQHNQKMIKRALKELNNGFDLVIGKREKKQRFAEIIFSFYTNLRWGIKDPLSGFKLYRKDIFQSMGYFDSYNSIGTELLFFALQNKYRVKEIPIKTNKREGKPRFGTYFSGNWKILKSLINHFLKNMFMHLN